MAELSIEVRPQVDRAEIRALTELLVKVAERALEIAWPEVESRGKGVPDPAGEITLLLTDDDEIRDLNRRFRNVDAPTDVLSFPMWDPDSGDPGLSGSPVVEPLGDVVISVPTAERQAEEYGHSLAREVAYLFVHGLLHLLGFDHETEEQRAQMRRLEEEVLEGLSLGR